MVVRQVPLHAEGLSLLIVALGIILVSAPIMAVNEEGQVLWEFGSSLNDPLGSLGNWNSSHSTPCLWTGVACSKGMRVVSINLSGKQLKGNLSLDVGRLSQLQALNLSTNSFECDIPSSLGNAINLTDLNLRENTLAGVIPSALALLVNLTYLDLSSNRLTGEIPEALKRLPKLSFLNLSINNLEGGVPVSGKLVSSNRRTLFEGKNHLRRGTPIKRMNERVRSLVDINSSSKPSIASEGTRSSSKKSLTVGAIVAICISAFAASKVVLGTLCYCRWSKKHSACEIKLSGGKMVMFQVSGKANPASKAVLRKTETLKKQDIIGSGGYGTVYKLVLDEKTSFAVKKLARGGQERERGFERELETLADIKHRNLVSLRGYYSAPHINILVYDLMPNGNLDTLLHDYARHEGKPLDWETRLNIAIGSARGLSYLHHDCIPHVVHRDIKTSNILLDEDMEAHVADFGLAKLISPQQTHVTTIMAGTLGYLPPEYMETGKVSEKGDIFSFGVVLLELLVGRRPTDNQFRDNNFSMVQWAKMLLEDGHPEDIFDEYLLGKCPDEDLLTTLDIAIQCANPQPIARPSMQQVVKMLERLRSEDSSSGSSFGLSSRRNLGSPFGASTTASLMDQSF